MYQCTCHPALGWLMETLSSSVSAGVLSVYTIWFAALVLLSCLPSAPCGAEEGQLSRKQLGNPLADLPPELSSQAQWAADGCLE